MSFAAIRSIATSSLATTQVQMAVTSANIANADTDGYSRKTAQQAAVSTGTVGAGVTVTAVTSTVDKYLLADLVSATSTLGAATTGDSYADKLQSLLGSATEGESGGSSIANSIADLETALTSLSGTPESETLQAQAVDALDTLASQFRELSDGIQELRGAADQSIEDSVAAVNDTLGSIAGFNDQIAAAQARGDSTADLEDQRNTALQTLAAQMDVSYYVNSDNQMRISTSSGTTLLSSSVHALSYSAAATTTQGTVFDGILVDGKDITAQVKSGTLGSLIDQRDTVLPAAQDELDELASGLIATLNGIHNSGTALPAPSSLTGTSSITASDAFSGSGSVRIATVDSSGGLVGYQDLDLSGFATIGDLVSAIDGIDGVSATIDASGHLAITADDTANGIAIGDLDGMVGDAQQGLSDYLGLNDLLTGTGAADMAVRADILKTPGRLATSTLSDEASPAVGATVVSVGDSGVAQQLSAAMTDDHAFAAAGSLKASSSSFSGYAAKIVAAIAQAADTASTSLTTSQTSKDTLANALASQSGVNLDEETARLTQLQQQYSTSAQLLDALNSMFDSLLQVVQAS